MRYFIYKTSNVLSILKRMNEETNEYKKNWEIVIPSVYGVQRSFGGLFSFLQSKLPVRPPLVSDYCSKIQLA